MSTNLKDQDGPTENAGSAGTLRFLEHEILAHRPNSARLLDQLIAESPNEALGYAVRSLCTLVGGRQQSRIASLSSISDANIRLTNSSMDNRARAYVRAASAWCEGSLSRAAAILDDWSNGNPSDVLGVKFCTAIRFMSGDIPGILRVTRRTLNQLEATQFGFGFILGCHAFALEELGEYSTAEAFGRQAVEKAPDDAWGMHAVAHVFEMTGRSRCGLEWLDLTQSRWEQCNNFSFHMAWHRGLFELSLGMFDAAIDTYDRNVRAVITDEYRDVANAISMLVRFERLGISVGERWGELVEIAHRQKADSTLVFSMLHNLMALARVNDSAGINTALETMRLLTQHRGDQGDVAAEVGLALATAIARPRYSGLSKWKIQGILDRLHSIGGSRAQRDVFVLHLLEQKSIQRIPGAVDLLVSYRAQAQQIPTETLACQWIHRKSAKSEKRENALFA